MTAKHIFSLFVAAMLTSASILPTYTIAASKTPSCSLTASTSHGKASTTGDDETIFVNKGDTLTVSWKRSDATSSTLNKKSVASVGTTTATITGDKTYTFVAKNGSKTKTCEFEVEVVSVAAQASTLKSTSLSPTVKGTASGVSSLKVQVYKEGSSRKVFENKKVSVKSGKWEVGIKSLSDGVYTVKVYVNEDSRISQIGSYKLLAGKAALQTGTLKVNSIPLLSGGVTGAGMTIPVSYLQIQNSGTATTSITGFGLTQTGSANASGITGFTVTDDRGVPRGITGGIEGATPFTGTSAVANLNIELAPQERRLFTIKAVLSANQVQNLSKAYSLNVSSVRSSGAIEAMFPIVGTTWIVSN